MNKNTDHANFVPEKFNDMLASYLMGTDAIVGAVIGAAVVREPERYSDAADLVKVGRLIPMVLSQPGKMTISLIDVETGASIGDIFHYSAPALEAQGVAH